MFVGDYVSKSVQYQPHIRLPSLLGSAVLSISPQNEREVEEKAVSQTPSQTQKNAGSFQVKMSYRLLGSPQ
ncbi:uncharacterized protein FIBRA_05178 [Fibroporia radiculosa]|uniref:Uncharacterized protein n=1 Tax=Fibroporia radiculosa TaxID=599839 RepID=J4G8Q8_9APHY|nr:uncharacterized protein FIBRA_05178 [Fibroporia radiculosa]CCM03058.1 predicted protein [Fibroporia radiculosa]